MTILNKKRETSKINKLCLTKEEVLLLKSEGSFNTLKYCWDNSLLDRRIYKSDHESFVRICRFKKNKTQFMFIEMDHVPLQILRSKKFLLNKD